MFVKKKQANQSNIELHSGYLAGRLLLATQNVGGSIFEKSVIFVCVHDNNGAMGIKINHVIGGITCSDIFKQLNTELPQKICNDPIYQGGPVETTRGFVLHSQDYKCSATQLIGKEFGITSTIDILKDIVNGRGPKKSIVALGYAGWDAGQLESEITQNSWITVPATDDLVFGTNDSKWERAAREMGITWPNFIDSPGNA